MVVQKLTASTPAKSIVGTQTLKVVGKPVVKAATPPVVAPAKIITPAAPITGKAVVQATKNK